jgi:hypothetical protein
MKKTLGTSVLGYYVLERTLNTLPAIKLPLTISIIELHLQGGANGLSIKSAIVFSKQN